jgi:tRNA synthetases class I (M)
LIWSTWHKKVIFITGTNEHGEKIASAAEDNNKSPKEHCDVISQAYRSLWSGLSVLKLFSFLISVVWSMQINDMFIFVFSSFK